MKSIRHVWIALAFLALGLTANPVDYCSASAANLRAAPTLSQGLVSSIDRGPAVHLKSLLNTSSRVSINEQVRRISSIGRVGALIGDVVMLDLFSVIVPELGKLGFVRRIETSGRTRLLLDVTVPEIEAPYVWQKLKDDYASVLYRFRLTTASGEVWYEKGAKAHAELDTGTVSDGMFCNLVFTGWAEDVSGTTVKSKPMAMNAPKTATAKWNHDFPMNFYCIIAVVVVVAALAAFMLMRSKQRTRPAMGSSVTHAAAPQLSGQKKFCTNCHAVLPVKANVCPSCGQPT